MDEALILCAVDLSGRGGYYEELSIPTEKIRAFDTQLVYEFMWAFAANARLTLHLREAGGRNSHHIVEGPSRPWAAPCGRRRRPIPASGTKFHPPKGCCKRETPC